MAKTTEIRRLIRRGDFPVIAEIFNKRHEDTDHRTISSSYVGKLIRGERTGSISQEIHEIAHLYIEKKEEFETELATL